ncbi:unnamed protein product [Larinioides sclopetarius]
MVELKKEQAEMLRMIEEKKMQLKALTQKKLEMAAKQKKKSAVGAVAIPQPNSEDKPLNHRDPRLKKNVLAPQTVVESAKNTIPLQSVVVVPKLPIESSANQIESEVSKTNRKVSPRPEVQNTTNEAHHSVTKVDQGPKTSKDSNKNECSERIPKENNTRKTVPSGEHVNNRNAKFQNKKHPLSPEKKTMPSKIFCKDSLNKKRSVHSTRLHPENTGPAIKKGKFEATKVKIEPGTESHISTYTDDPILGVHNKEMHPPDQRLTDSYQGNRDMDYRHHPRNANILKNKPWAQQQGRRMNSRRTPNTFFSRDGNKDNMHVSDQKYPPIKIEPDESLMRNKEFRRIDNLDKPQNASEVDASRITVKKEIPDQGYNSKPILSHERLQPPQQPRTFMLDGKNRKLYFVNNRCFTIMDNNEPREITFSGGPRNVYVEGLPKPLILGFDGRPLEFETDGKRNIIHFGAPSREVYVNDYPYEAYFGGQSFTATLEDKKEHRIRIDGPPPQVIIGEKPAYDLYEIYNRDKRISPIPPSMDSNLNNKGPESSVLQDVDMRSKPSHLMKSSIMPESMKDVDWRRVPLVEGSKIPWNMPQDVPVASNVNYSSQTGISTSHWDNGSSKGILSDTSAMERNNNVPWPHPTYRGEMMPIGDRPLIDQPLPVNTQAQAIPPNSSWELKPQTSLPPPPAIPPSLSNLSLPPNLPNLSSVSTSMPQMPNVSVPPPNWNPLPPPPMFTGSLPDALKSTSLSTTITSSTTNILPESMTATTAVPLPTLPINVETIYEKLVAAGIITEKPKESADKVPESTESNEDTTTEKKETVTEEEEIPEPEILLTPKSLRQFRPSIIAALYKGAQCATCGMRFKEIQSEQYSRHLDWHFRMNRREKDGAKKAYSRRLFYEIKDWIQFNEIEEAEERTPSYFELQADGDMAKNDEKEKIQSVPASECETEKCSVCGEQFQLFWVEEEEEWHLKHAVSHDGEAYHPMCYEDFKKATELAKKRAEEEAAELAKKQAEEEAAELAKKQAEEAAAKEEVKAAPSEETSLVEAKEEKPDEDDKKETPIEIEMEQKTEPESNASDEGTKSAEEKSGDDKFATTLEEPASEAMEVDAVEQEAPEIEQPVEEVRPEKTVVSSSDSELDSFEDEFRPPTPDPRFDVQPPIMKGTELSALCTIM